MSPGSHPRAWPFHDGGKFCLLLSWQWECWSLGHDSSSCCWAPPGWVWHHPHTQRKLWGLVGDLWGLVASPLTYLYGSVQSPQVKDLCGHVSSSPRELWQPVRHRGGIAWSSAGGLNGSRQGK